MVTKKIPTSSWMKKIPCGTPLGLWECFKHKMCLDEIRTQKLVVAVGFCFMSESVEGVTFIQICTRVLFCFLYRRLYLSPFPLNRTFYGIPEDFPRNQVMYRTENGQRRTLYFVSSAIRDLVRKNNDRFKVISLRIEILVMFKLLEETNDKYYKITVKNKKYSKTCPI